MTSLVDYLQTKLKQCACPYGWSLGRPAIGRLDLKRWQPGCPMHPTGEALEVENAEKRDWFMSLPEPVPARRKRWWRR